MSLQFPELDVSDFPGAVVSPPRLLKVRQRVAVPCVPDLRESIHSQFGKIGPAIRKHDKICIAVGSRGIAHLPEIVRMVVHEVRQCGADAVIVPAMGSHGGATAHGQIQILAELGVTEASVGVPIVASMDVVPVGKLSGGQTVVFSRDALACDGVIVINRIKPHTAFRGPVESGLAKMLTIGLGKQIGAALLHQVGFAKFGTVLHEAARMVIQRCHILGGVGIIENARGEVAQLAILRADEILGQEPYLLREARRLLPRIPFEDFDVLVIQRAGKDISGDGMDPNVTGRFGTHFQNPDGPRFRKLALLSLTPASLGNAVGIGQADVIPISLLKEIDFSKTYINAITSSEFAGAKVPLVVKTERDAVELCIRTCGKDSGRDCMLVWILDTLYLENFWVSEPLAKKIVEAGRSDLSIISEPVDIEFDESGRALLDF